MFPSEPVFNAPWEAEAFAMAVKLHEAGAFTWAEWSEALAREIHSGDADYYEHWLAALEKLLEAKGVMSRSERLARIDAWDRAAKATPHGQPIELSRSSEAPGRFRATSRTSSASFPRGT